MCRRTGRNRSRVTDAPDPVHMCSAFSSIGIDWMHQTIFFVIYPGAQAASRGKERAPVSYQIDQLIL